MSFKLKIVSLILSVSLMPYIILMVYAGNTLRKKYYENTQHELKMQLDLSIENMEQYINMIKRDMLFISNLEIMNDVFSKDVDRRISILLEKKKKELSIEGDFFVYDKNGVIIASSNPKMILKKDKIKAFFSQDIYSPFDKSVIAKIVLKFSLKNLIKLYENTEDRHYYIVVDKTKELFKEDSFENEITVRKALDTRPKIVVVLEQNQEQFLNLLKKYELWFILTLFIGAIIIASLALFFINKLIRPIIELSKVAEDITHKQDYSYQVKVYSDDEVGRLSSSFNKMITGMQMALIKLQEEAKNRENLIEEKSKSEMLEKLSTKLSRYLSPQVYQSIFSGEQDVTLTSKRKKLTIFFSDIIGFTDITDTMESEDLSNLLNDYLNEMTLIALKYGATVDKYIGDSIMLFFGDPYSKGVKDDAIACVNMALDMNERMSFLHKKWKNSGFTKPFDVRIGIHTGYCTVGNFGSKDRLEYTIIGSSVNLASRIESSAKPQEILISNETQLLVSDSFECKKSKEIMLKGFKRPVSLYVVEKKIKEIEKELLDIKKNGFELSYNINELSLDDKSILKEELSSLIKNL